MPLYNKEREVSTTIASILNQTFTDFELLVINDGSTDLSVQVVEKFDDPRISINNQENAGVSAARNTGVRLAQSELIVFIDADDLWHPDFLATIIALTNDYPQARWFATGYEIVHPETGRSLSTLKGPAKNFRRGILPNYFGVGGLLRSAGLVIGNRSAARRHSGHWGLSGGHWQRRGFADLGPAGGAVPAGLRCAAVWRVFAPLAFERRPDPADKVGQALVQLVEDFPRAKLARYLGLWYRMQAVMAMRFGDAALARQRAGLAVRYGPGNCAICTRLFLALLPPPGARLWTPGHAACSEIDKGNAAS
jgi:hypothetical protein